MKSGVNYGAYYLFAPFESFCTDQLLRFPEIGKPLADELQWRELFFSFGAGSYVLRYRLDKDDIVVIRVLRSRESR